MADNSFTFWANMKEVIDVYDDIEYKYKLYDALTEYGLYGIWPEDDGSKEAKDLICFVQTMVPTLDKSRNFNKNASDAGAIGGRNQKVTDEQIERAIINATLKKNEVPSRNEVVASLLELEGISVTPKTISRRYPDEKKREISLKALEGQNRDKINVSVGDIETYRDKIDVPSRDKMGTQGQNRDISNVPVVFEF